MFTDYVLPIETIRNIAKQAKHKKVTVTKDVIGNVDLTDAMMHTWAYMNDVAVHNLRYGYITKNWQDIGEAENWLKKNNIIFQ